MSRIKLITALMLSMVVASAAASDFTDAPFKRELQLIYLFEGDKPSYIFVIGQSGFRTVATLKEHLETWPRGSELTWAPGCVQFGNEPLLSSVADMEAFRAFLAKRGITFVLVPSG